jgi:putative copper export protein/methionine-rich copper-binding protein CopC
MTATSIPEMRRRLALLWAAVLAIMLAGLLASLPSAVGAAVASSDRSNSLIASVPADGATLDRSPEQLVFVFANALGADDSFTAPVACGNAPQGTGLPDLGNNSNEVTVAITEPLPRGACTVSWALRDGLGEVVDTGLLTFSVSGTGTEGGDSPTTTIASRPTTTATADADDGGGSGGALWFGRFLSTSAILALFGGIVMLGVAWPEGPEYVITVRFLRAVWLVALVGTILFVIAFTASASDISFGAALSPTAWIDLADAGWAGRAALARLLLVVACAWVVLRPERVIDPTSQLAAYALVTLTVVTVGLSRVGGSLVLVGVVLAIAHAAAAGVWFGGALLVGRVVVAGPGDEDLVHAVRGFNRISLPAILITVVTGVLQMFRIVGGGLFTSGHGLVLLLKTLVVAAMVFVAIAARQLVAQRLRRADQLTAASATRFRRAFGAEAAIGAVVLATSAWLLSLTPAGIDDRPSFVVEQRFTDPASGLDVTVFLTPAEVGLNALRVEVNAPQEGISNLNIAFLPPEGLLARGIDQPIPLFGAGTAFLDRADGIPLDVPGQWTMQVSGSTPQGTLTGASKSFEVRGDPVPTTLPAATTVPATGTDGTDGNGVNDGPEVVIETIE